MPNTQTVTLSVNTAPFTLAAKSLERALELGKFPLGLPDLPVELVRIEYDKRPTRGAGELAMTLYPSDALLRFMAAVFTGDGDFSIVE